MTEKTGLVVEKELCHKKIARHLDGWREVVLHANSILLWKRNQFPWLIFGVVSFIFLELAYHDLTLITTLSLVLIIVTAVDYFGPTICGAIFKPENWTPSKQREYEEVCESLAASWISVKLFLIMCFDLKTKNPGMYYLFLTAGLAVLAFIGNAVNNLLITYVLVVGTLMAPGLIHYGIIQKYYKLVMLQVANLLRSRHPTLKKD